MSNRNYFAFDEIDNVIDNLEMTTHFLKLPTGFKWKWVCISLHQALYGLMIAALKGSDARLTIYDKSKDQGKAIALHAQGVSITVIANSFGVSDEKVRQWLSNPWLIPFSEALDRVKRINYLPPNENVRPLKLTSDEKRSIEKLSKEYRNEFEHFSPKRWAINWSGFPGIVRDVLRIINFLTFESNCLTFSNEQEDRLKTAISAITKLIDNETA